MTPSLGVHLHPWLRLSAVKTVVGYSQQHFLIKGCNFFLQVFQIVTFSNYRCLRPASESAEIRKVLHIPPALPYTKCSKQLSGIFYLGLNSNSFSSPDSHILQMKLTLLDLWIFFFSPVAPKFYLLHPVFATHCNIPCLIAARLRSDFHAINKMYYYRVIKSEIQQHVRRAGAASWKALKTHH